MVAKRPTTDTTVVIPINDDHVLSPSNPELALGRFSVQSAWLAAQHQALAERARQASGVQTGT
jgi:hypothetical protein